MPTHYKPTQWRGKRVVYQSIDPAEQKRETIKGIIMLSIVIIFLAVGWWLTR